MGLIYVDDIFANKHVIIMEFKFILIDIRRAENTDTSLCIVDINWRICQTSSQCGNLRERTLFPIISKRLLD